MVDGGEQVFGEGGDERGEVGEGAGGVGGVEAAEEVAGWGGVSWWWKEGKEGNWRGRMYRALSNWSAMVGRIAGVAGVAGFVGGRRVLTVDWRSMSISMGKQR